MYYTYLNQQLIPGNKYLFHTNLVHKGKIKKFTGTFIDVTRSMLRVEDYDDGKYRQCEMIFWTIPIEWITNITPITKNICLL